MQRLFLIAFILSTPRIAAADPIQLVERRLELLGRALDLDITDIDGDGAKDLICAHLQGDGAIGPQGRMRRFLSVFLQNPKALPAARWPQRASQTIEVPDDVALFATGDFLPEAGSEVVLLAHDAITILKRDAQGRPLGARDVIKTPEGGFFDFPANGGLFLWTLAPDLDNDGRRELLAPVKSGYLIYGVQAKPGTKPEAKAEFGLRSVIDVPSSERFGPPMETEFLNRFLTYISTLQRVIAIDMDGDGRKDLVSYRKKGLSTFLQRGDGTFPKEPDREVPLKIVSEAEDASKKADGSAGAQKDAFENVMLALRDLDNDKQIDLVAMKTLGKIGVFESLRTQVLIFRGAGAGLQDAKPNLILNLKGVTLFPEFTDFNGDGDTDIVLSSLRMDLLSNVKRAILKNVSTTYTIHLYRGGPRVYSEDPDFERSVDVDLDLVEKQGQVRLSFFSGDYNGDGLKDMLTVAAKDKLSLIPGGVEKSFFSGSRLALKDSEELSFTTPTSPNLTIEDIDGDKKDEVIILNLKPDDPSRAFIRIIEAE